MAKILRLKDRFRPIFHDRFWKLLDNYTALEYLLDKQRYELILNLDGTKTLDDILKIFNKSSWLTINKFINKLKDIQALEELTVPHKRYFADNYPHPYLESVLWDITSFCNLNCAHCYVSEFSHQAKGKDLTTQETYSVIEEMKSMNVEDVSLTGGEPLMKKDLREIISAILKSGGRLSAIFTNGISVTQDFINFLKKTVPYQKNKFCIRISLDGATPKSNTILRGTKIGSAKLFRKTIETIKKFVNAGFFVSIGTCVHRFNVHEILEMYSLMKKLNVSKWRLAVPKPVGRFLQNSNSVAANWFDVLEAYRKLIDIHLKEVKIINDERVLPLHIGIEEVFHTELLIRTLNVFQKNDLACFYHKNHCSIKANGDVVPCGYLDDIVSGNVKNEGLKKSWESKTMQGIKNIRISEVKDCCNCEFLHYCGTGCRAIARQIKGSLFAKDPYACQQVPFFKQVVMQMMKKYKLSPTISRKCREFSISGH